MLGNYLKCGERPGAISKKCHLVPPLFSIQCIYKELVVVFVFCIHFVCCQTYSVFHCLKFSISRLFLGAIRIHSKFIRCKRAPLFIHKGPAKLRGLLLWSVTSSLSQFLFLCIFNFLPKMYRKSPTLSSCSAVLHLCLYVCGFYAFCLFVSYFFASGRLSHLHFTFPPS